ncbi:MAG: AmmeMemoRadiSam system radical SAM enzyme [Candidatus Micrarchaeaceae archaeon]
MIKEAILYQKMENGKVECTACARRCKIPDGLRGFCFVRRNEGGRLVLATYGTVNAMQIDPIEKKPFNHFYPGTYVLGIGTSSCNWGCHFCQNHNISKEREITGFEISPVEVVETALRENVSGVAFTYNEPAIFIEYALDVAKIAHKKGLYAVFVTNGYLTADAVAEMRGKIDAAVVDFKGSGEQKFSNKYEIVQSCEPIKEAMLELKDSGIHIEITDLIIPGVGESLEACDSLVKWICSNLGPDTPIQFTAFHPDYKMLDYPHTPYATLKMHYNIAKENGMKYAYIGNVPGNPYENTYCPKCGAVVIERNSLYLKASFLDEKNKCKNCKTKIPITGSFTSQVTHRDIRALY